MKLKATLISLISVLIVGAVAISLYCFWPAIKGTIDNSKYYTEEELQASYDKGFEDGCKTETELLGQIDYYKGIVDEYYIQVNTLNDEIAMLSDKNNDYVGQISSLNGIIEENESTIESLQSTISDNNTTISGLNTQISGLNSEIDSLESDIEDLQNELSQANEDYQILQAELTTKTNQVISLQNQVNNLQTLVNQLNATNELNLTTISTLNSQIETLNSQISDLTYQINNNDSTVASLNNQIAQLQESISYYENYISNLESETQVVVTFEFDGSVYNIQIVNKGATVSVVNPTSTDYVQFNYWTINEEQIDLSSYTFNTNTKVVADVTYSYDVTFYVDNAEHNTQIVEYGNQATTPTVPTKTGYTFLGWSLNGSDIVDLSTVTITENTNFYALFVQQFSVQFVYEDDVISTQTINNGAYATSPSVESTTYKVFNGWKVNGTSVNVETYKIVGATTFVADITYKYDVTFMVDDEEYNTQIVTSGQYATVPVAPTKDGYIFKGWSLNGSDIIDLSGNSITATTTYYAVFGLQAGFYSDDNVLLYSWEELLTNKYLSISSDGVLSKGSNIANFRNLNGKLILSSDVIQITDGKSLNDGVFYNCINLTSITLPENLIYIGKYAFYNCKGLTEINFNSVEMNDLRHANFIFADCGIDATGIIVNIDSKVKSIPNYIFAPYGSNTRYAPNIVSVNFADNSICERIGDGAFTNCIYLTNINIPDSVTYIGDSAFMDCDFSSITLSNNITHIGQNAFMGNENLTSIWLSSNITTIEAPTNYGFAPFRNCYSLVIYCESNEVPSGWGEYWNYCGSDNIHTVKYGYTYEQYLAEIGA